MRPICLTHHILLDLITLIVLVEEYELSSSSLGKFRQFISCHVEASILLSNLAPCSSYWIGTNIDNHIRQYVKLQFYIFQFLWFLNRIREHTRMYPKVSGLSR
jgi:hypothetical protein